MSKHTIVQSRSWTDPEPDTFTVSVETSNEDGDAFVVVSGNATWLTAAQALDAAQYMAKCAWKCVELNAREELA